MKQLQGRVAVVTGAASGIGLAMARRFASAGMHMVLADIEEGPLNRARDEILATGAQAIAMKVDVMSEAQVGELADAAYARFGVVHVVCNNAGVAAPALRTRAWESTIADWQWIHNVNFMGVLHGVRAFVPRMLAAGDEGHIVNTASVAGLLTGANPYHVSKHAVSCLTEGLYKDLRTLGARVSASVLCPGLIKTGILDAERNRPAEFGPATDLGALAPDVQAWASGFRSALAGGYEPSQVADAVAQAILEDRYYIVPAQPFLLELIRTRMQDIIDQRNPTMAPPA
ncbi:MAG: SDR family NAD(P)-dependent oxidoreductase [Burkholderiales bacterium]|nr:SDR family NAD(P)-dependent oxidoreductase [Burkholderiales bacterium]